MTGPALSPSPATTDSLAMEAGPAPINLAEPPPSPGRAVALALLREAAREQAAGRRLFMGRWRAAGEDAAARRQARRQGLRDCAEMALLWLGLALLGLAFAGLAVILV